MKQLNIPWHIPWQYDTTCPTLPVATMPQNIK